MAEYFDQNNINRENSSSENNNTESHGYTWSSSDGNVDYGKMAGASYGYATPIYGDEKKKKEKKSGKGGFAALAVVLCIVFSVASGIGGAYFAVNHFIDGNEGQVNAGGNETEKETEVNNNGGTVSSGTDIDRGDLEPGTIVKSDSVPREVLDGTIAAATEKAYDSVVVITTETAVYDSFFGQYINDGAGSGVIISENGYIVTCAHVVDGSTTITVTMTDGTKYDAKIVGSDAQTDIAVLKIDATGLPFSIIGNSDQLVIGETAIAIGNPLGTLGGTVTNGIISALDREVEIEGTKYTLLQTNAEINPGNSGGGLFNIDGELIGVVNAKSSGSAVEGLGFAIPINEAMNIAEQLMNYGYIKGRPQLGITIVTIEDYSDLYDIRSEYPELLNYVTDYGMYVTNWQNGDFKFGDRIIALDDVPVSTFSELKSVLYNHEIGDTISVTVSRLTSRQQSRLTTFEITLTEYVPES